MIDDSREFQAGELIRVIGKVQLPAPHVLESAREVLWSAVASEMIGIGPAAEQPATTGGSAGRGEGHRTAPRRQPNLSQDDRRRSVGGDS
jgi:hypothetical protein